MPDEYRQPSGSLISFTPPVPSDSAVVRTPMASSVQYGTPNQTPAELGIGTYTGPLVFDEGSGCVVDGIAYMISGAPGNSAEYYLTSILRYNLATDQWMSPVTIPPPAGAPIPPSWQEFTVSPATQPNGVLKTFVLADITIPAGAPVPVTMFAIHITSNGNTLGLFPGQVFVNLLNHDNADAPIGSWTFQLTSGYIAGTPLQSGVAMYQDAASMGLSDLRGKRFRITVSTPDGTAAITAAVIDPLVVTLNTYGTLWNRASVTGKWGFEGGYYGAIGKKLYFGGGDSNLYTPIGDDGTWDAGDGRQLVSYDTVTGKFATLAVKPHGVDYCGFGVADNKLYTLTSQFLEIYNPATNTWQSYDISAAYTTWISDWAQGVQAGRFLYWPDAGVKLDLDANPTSAAAWVAIPTAEGWTDGEPAVQMGQDGKIHVFLNGSTGSHFILDPATDTYTVDRSTKIAREYFSAFQTPRGLWRFFGGTIMGWDENQTLVNHVAREVQTVDPILTESKNGLAGTLTLSVSDDGPNPHWPVYYDMADGQGITFHVFLVVNLNDTFTVQWDGEDLNWQLDTWWITPVANNWVHLNSNSPLTVIDGVVKLFDSTTGGPLPMLSITPDNAIIYNGSTVNGDATNSKILFGRIRIRRP